MDAAHDALKGVACGDGGLLRFRVPTAWDTTVERDGCTAFFDPSLEAGTLRVKVTTFTADEEVPADQALRQLQAIRAEPGQTLLSLPSGNALRRHREQAVVDGEPTVMHVWLLASVDPPHRMQLAVFSFAVLASRATAPDTGRLVTALDREIRRARFRHQIS